MPARMMRRDEILRRLLFRAGAATAAASIPGKAGRYRQKEESPRFFSLYLSREISFPSIRGLK